MTQVFHLFYLLYSRKEILTLFREDSERTSNNGSIGYISDCRRFGHLITKDRVIIYLTFDTILSPGERPTIPSELHRENCQPLEIQRERL